ncbi:MAG: hypothetical protein WC101_01020 [Candidatus Gracilibacteria bacterium]
MAEPIKTTVQAAFDHIKDWVSKGEKDKAIKGLQELLSFDPGNSDAQKMLAELGGTIPTPAVVPAPMPAATVTPTATVPTAMPATAFKLDMDLKPTAPVATAPITPTTTPTAPVVTPAPTPVIPKPVPAPTPVPTTPAVTPAPVVPKPTPIAPTPAPLSPLKPITSAAAPEILTKEMERGEMPTTGPSMLSAVQGLSQNAKWAIFVGVLAVAIIGGFFFYKTFLSASQPLSSDIQQQAEKIDTSTLPIENTAPDITAPVEPIATPSTSTTDGTLANPLTGDISAPTGDTTTPSTPASTDTTGGKVKRR